MVQSPYDTEARYSWKREVGWVRYKVHLTETCDEDNPNLITHVETATATSPDLRALDAVHDDLSEKELLPAQKVPGRRGLHGIRGDSGRSMWARRRPVRTDAPRRQLAGQNGGRHRLHPLSDQLGGAGGDCPEGKKSRYWKPELNRHGRDVVAVLFAKAVCGACESRPLCTRSRFTGRELTLRPQPQHEVLLEVRKRQSTKEFWEEYGARAGVEGTSSQGIRGFGLRRSGYVGMDKTRLQYVITAVAINVVRLLAWFAGVPKAQTRLSPFARLAPASC